MEHPCSTREIDRDSHCYGWESRLYTERFEGVANAMLDELRPRERTACVSAWASQSESGQRVTRADLRELCVEHNADLEPVAAVFGYFRMARLNSANVVVGPGSPVDILGDDTRILVYVDPLAKTALHAIWLLREAFMLDHIRIAFHGETFTEKEH